jgi:organic hydroperoxide reductase OsmC/OhrA
MDTTNNLSEKKLVEQLDTPEQLSPAFIAACHCSTDKQLLDEELEYLWDDSDTTGKSYEIYLGKISRNPIVKSKLTGKYFALPWSVIIKLALEKGIDK